MKTFLDFVLITSSFAIRFSQLSATWILAFVGMSFIQITFASFRGGSCENKYYMCLSLLTFNQFRHPDHTIKAMMAHVHAPSVKGLSHHTGKLSMPCCLSNGLPVEILVLLLPTPLHVSSQHCQKPSTGVCLQVKVNLPPDE